MANKYELISKLAEETAKEVVENGETWKRYLDTAARIYKYPFQEQLLIYAQRPDATACASIDIWNSRRFNCWVNKGAKGIALIDEDAPRPRLKYVFDISDIHKARRIGRTPYLWKMEPEHQETVIDHLEHIYGGTRQDKSFEERLLEIAQRITLDCYEEVWEDLQYLTEGSYLEGLDEYSGKVHLRETMQSSISYTLQARCGMDMENYEELLNFDYIHEFNTIPVLSQLGSNITELCKPVLMEIGKAIRAYDREISKKRVANHNNLDYNALKRESKRQNKVEDANENPENSRNEERSQDYVTDISEERRLLHP
ncbi:MAG: helicase SNF2, partial [Blautia massiliensis]|nr:helicase SNF2 [Blautia massiliensis (ex Durand et al. 2017)]